MRVLSWGAMKRFLPLCLVLPLLLAGCGGHAGTDPEAGIKVAYIVTPEKASVATGGTVPLLAYVLEGGASALEVKVREGSAGGSVTAPANASYSELTYTAPSTPGTYHVDATFTGLAGTGDAGKTHNASATITVVAAP